MKHAYLIIAHNEFEVLARLVAELDDISNDIFIHFDKKVKSIPALAVKSSSLIVISNRIDVRWGTVSQLEAEYSLIEEASSFGPYDFYHFISGTHLPIKSQHVINEFFENVRGAEVLRLWDFPEKESVTKIRRYSYFLNGFQAPNAMKRLLCQKLWYYCQKIQKILGVYRYKNEVFYKADQWLNLSESAIQYLISEKGYILKKYRRTFCCDEFAFASELIRRQDLFRIISSTDVLFVDFVTVSPRYLTMSDYQELSSSSCLFARKFRGDDTVFLDKVVSLCHQHSNTPI